jgi:hypothetical protein
MGRRQGDTDLQTLQRHVHDNNAILIERARWLRRILRRRRQRKWMYAAETTIAGAYRPMTPLAFQVMVNETLRRCGITATATARWRGE